MRFMERKKEDEFSYCTAARNELKHIKHTRYVY